MEAIDAVLTIHRTIQRGLACLYYPVCPALIGPQSRGHKHIVSDIGARLTVSGRITLCAYEDLKKLHRLY